MKTLETHTLFTIYGRGFGISPVLGRLGRYKGFDDMEAAIGPWAEEVEREGNRPVEMGVELIYAMAIPCRKGDCLDYLPGNLVDDYIKPAAARHMAVILESQLGRATPAAQIQHMIDQGYLQYDNVSVAIDPEFHAAAGQATPGTPVGSITGAQINEAAELLNTYVEKQRLATAKILIVHQFGDPPVMIRDKSAVRRFSNVEIVDDMDGLGSPDLKALTYNRCTGAHQVPGMPFRGIKLFYADPWNPSHEDTPPLEMPQIFGRTPIGRGLRLESKPNVVIVA